MGSLNDGVGPMSHPVGAFATTHWSVVLAAGRADQPQALDALERLCRAYWYPLYAYVRRRGFDEHDAKDLTQGFFEQLIERHHLAKADPERGRFRSFLLKGMQYYLANEQRKARQLKRGGGKPVVTIDDTAETRYRVEPFHELTPEKLYERRWAMALISQALERLRTDYAAADQAALYQELEGLLTGTGRGTHLAEIGKRLGMSEGAVKAASHRLRKRFGQVLRGTILETVSTADEVDAELRNLQTVIQEGLTTIGPGPGAGNLSAQTG